MLFTALMKQIESTSAKIYVDANGGWTQDEALHMAEWLKTFGVLFVVQWFVSHRVDWNLREVFRRELVEGGR